MKRQFFALAALFAGACGWGVPTSAPIAPMQGPSTADEQQFAALEASLAAGRTQALDKSAQELYAIGDTLYWKTYPSFDAALHARAGSVTTDFQFSIGDGDDNNFVGSTSHVVTALNDGDKVVYSIYAASSANTLEQQVPFDAPTDEQKWWAYAIDGDTVYVVTTGDATTLYRWTVGQSPQVVTTLEAAGAQVGTFANFDVEGDTMMFIESGRLWSLDMNAKQATFLHNQTQILSGWVDFDQTGVVYEDATSLEYFDLTVQMTRDLGAELRASPYKLNDTYAQIHYFYSATSSNNFTRWKNWVIYTASAGIFAYELTTKSVVPLLINEADDDGNRIDYRYPVTLDSGAAFIVGLTSTSGSVGADGPVYQIDLTKLLQ